MSDIDVSISIVEKQPVEVSLVERQVINIALRDQGPRGEKGDDGAAGPNEVTTSTATSITGILKGDGAHVAQAIEGTDYAGAGHTHDLAYAPIGAGVTNGDSHDHSGGDGAQIDHGGLGGLGDDDHSQYHNDTRGDARYPIAIVDTKANILAMTCTGRRLAFATDTYEFFFDNGTAWYLMPFALIAEPAAPDMGVEQGSSRIGYGTDYVSDKDIVNCLLLGNARSEEGAFRTASGVFQIYLNGVWNDVVINFRFREHSAGAYELEHMPIGYTEWYEVMSGNSNSLGLNGYPLIQQYTASMGPYPVPLEIDGGAF